MNVLWIPTLIGKVGEEEGNGLALRAEGNELLFAPAGGKPMRWVLTGEFAVEDGMILEPEDVLEAEAAADSPGVPEQPPTPFPRRRSK